MKNLTRYLKKILNVTLLCLWCATACAQSDNDEGFSKDSADFYQQKLEEAFADKDIVRSSLGTRTVEDTLFADSVIISNYADGQVALIKFCYSPSTRYYGRPSRYYDIRERYYRRSLRVNRCFQRRAERFQQRVTQQFGSMEKFYYSSNYSDVRFPRLPRFYIESHTPLLDSIVRKYYPNGRLCYEKQYFNGHCTAFSTYFSNGQPAIDSRVQKGMTDAYPAKTSFYVDYGDYLYLYGFKVRKRTFLSYHYNGKTKQMVFEGEFCHKKVDISIEWFQGELRGAWIYDKSGRLMAQFDWNRRSGTWDTPSMNHVQSKKDFRKNKRTRTITII